MTNYVSKLMDAGRFVQPGPSELKEPKKRPMTLADQLLHDAYEAGRPLFGKIQHWWNNPETQAGLELVDMMNPMMVLGKRAASADIGKLKKAIGLEGAGTPRESIWDSTGWFKGPDGQWKFEIDDSAASIKFGDGEGVAGPYSSIQHKGLAEAYPDALGGVFHRVERGKKGAGKYQPGELREHLGLFDLSPEVRVMAPNENEAKSVALHELQHAIQEIEGFAKGGTPSDFSIMSDVSQGQLDSINQSLRGLSKAMDAPGGKVNPRLRQQYDELLAKRQGLVDAMRQNKPFDSYRKLAGEAEARMVQRRMDMTPEERRLTPPWLSLDVPEPELIVRMNRGE